MAAAKVAPRHLIFEGPSLPDTTQQRAIQKADVLIEALGWIRRFRDKVTVIKIGGSVMETEAALGHLLLDIVFLETVGMRVVLVHGGGAAISRAMDAAGLQPRFIQGRRYTDDATRDIVERILAYETNEALAAKIEEFGGRAMPLNFRTTNVLFGERMQLRRRRRPADRSGARRPGDARRPHDDRQFCYAGTVPVIPSMCLGPDGGKLNVNADTAATAVAQALGAEKLVFLSDVNGVRAKKDDPTRWSTRSPPGRPAS